MAVIKAPIDNDSDGYTVEVDCDDAQREVHPSATEVCNGIDDNCDGLTDDDDPAATRPVWFADTDADSFGDPASPLAAYSAPSGYVVDDTDCDDSITTVHPGALEVCNGTDDNCDALTEDDDPGVDTATYSTWWVDLDADGYGDPGATVSACAQPASSSTVATDCDDSDGSVHPGAIDSRRRPHPTSRPVRCPPQRQGDCAALLRTSSERLCIEWMRPCLPTPAPTQAPGAPPP